MSRSQPTRPARSPVSGRTLCVWLAVACMAAGRAAAAQEAAAELPDADSSAPAPATALQGPQLVAALRRGGYVVYFRHTATDYSRDDTGMRDLGDCDNQRLLSAQGRRDATDIGLRIRALGLPVGEVLASPFCRTMEHARLMLGPASPRNEIRVVQAGDYPGLKRLLAAPVPAGTNRWIVGHGIPFRSVAGPPHLAEGEAAVIRPGQAPGRSRAGPDLRQGSADAPTGRGLVDPRGATRWTVLARLSVADWQALAER